jgi:hypothetical protein
MKNLLKTYIRTVLNESSPSPVSFRGSGISPAAVKKDLISYIERLVARFENRATVDVPVVKPTSMPENMEVVDSSTTGIDADVNISSVSVGESITFSLKKLEWIIYQFMGRIGPSWGAAIKDAGGRYVRIDSFQKSGYFDADKANVMQKQNLQEQGLNQSLQEIIAAAGSEFAYLSISSRATMPRITGVTAIGGTPKADVEVKGVTPAESVFLSLKDGTTVKDFQQYGGITSYKDYPEVISFAYKIWNLTDYDESEPKRRILPFSEVYTAEVSEDLVLATVYGKDAADSRAKFGTEKCDALIQGTPESVSFVKIKSKGGIPVVELVANGHILTYPELPTNEFSPVLLARRDNSTTLSGFGPFTKNQGVRFLCYPYGKMTQKAVELEEALGIVWNGRVPGDVENKAYDRPGAVKKKKKN